MRSGFPFPGTRWAHTLRRTALCLCLLGAARTAAAATLAGRVVDPDGRAVPHVRIVITGPLGAVADTVTGAAGDYEVADLPDGRYAVRVVADGFVAPVAEVIVAGGERRELPIQLRLGAVEEAIVVSASQIDAARSEIPASVTVITAADLQARQIETVADALRDVPGLSVTRSGGRGGLTSLFPRGGSSNYTLVLVDGVRTNTFGGAFDFAHLSVANIDRIEVVRGPQSALYGSEAIGAVVQVITKRGGAPSLNGLLEAGSQGTVRATVGTAGSRGAWSWGLGAERLATDGFTGATSDAGDTVTNDDYTRTQATGTLGYRGGGGVDAMVAASLGTDERGFPGPWGANPIGVFGGIDAVSRGTNENRRVGVRVAHPLPAGVRQRIEASYTDLASDFVSGFGPSSSGTKRFDGRIQEDVAVSRQLVLSAGAEFIREQGRSTFVTGDGGQPIPVNRRSLGLFGEARLTAGRRLIVTAGLRLEHMVRQAVEPDPTAFQPRPLLPRQSIRSLNPKLAAVYTVGPLAGAWATTRVRASAGTGIRPPDVFEIAFTDNADLQPERSRSVEAGVEQQLARGAVVLDAAWFGNRYDDLIVTVGRALGGASRYRTDNISNARARGLELSAQTRLPYGLRAAGTYTRLATETLAVDGLGAAPPPFRAGDPLIRRPGHQGALDLRYATSRLSAFATVTLRSRMLDLEPNFGGSGGLFDTPGYAVIDFGAAVPLRRGLELFGRINNAANRRYEETLGYPALGRTGLVGVRVAASR